MSFESLPADGIPRRALLIMPVAFTGWLVFSRPSIRTLPDPAQSGAGPSIRLVLFSASGECEGVRTLRKTMKPDGVWRKELTQEQYAVTRRRATEFAFANQYWNAHAPGIYRCVCCGNALFRSQAKFDSGTGWPSFSAPIANENIYTAVDRSLPAARLEVLCAKCDAHLGHLFDDGPPPTGMRYCLNSAAMQFVPYAASSASPREHFPA